MKDNKEPGTEAQKAARAKKVESDLALLRAQLVAPVVRRKPVTDALQAAPVPRINPYRPASLDDVVGQTKTLRQLRLVLHGARMRGTKIPNILLSGAPGYGKSSLAEVIADEAQLPMIATTGMMLRKADDIVALLVKQTAPCLMFIDEVHAAKRPVLEAIYTILESGTIDLLGGGEASRHEIPELVTVAATTHTGLLPAPFVGRFFAVVMDDYTTDELATIAGRVWDKRGMPYVPTEATELARRSRGTPRRAVSLAERVLDVVTVKGQDKIEDGEVAESLSLFGISGNGLDEQDMSVLRVLCKEYAGKAVGLAALAQMVGVEESTITGAIEPWLIKSGLILRTRAGRLATRAAYELLDSNTD